MIRGRRLRLTRRDGRETLNDALNDLLDERDLRRTARRARPSCARRRDLLAAAKAGRGRDMQNWRRAGAGVRGD